MKWLHWRHMAVALAVLAFCAAPILAQEPATDKKKETVVSFGVLESTAPEVAKTKAADWLKSVGKNDAETLKKFDAVWASDKTTLEKVADTLVLGDEEAARLMEEARDASQPAPTKVAPIFSDPKKATFLKANLAIVYAKALAGRRVYEEALDALKTAKVEQVVDPAAYLFHKAVFEHAMLKQEDANRTILRLLDDVTDAPERYKMVAALMHFDMLAWRPETDPDTIARLGGVGRIMNNIERRLDLARGGPVTQEMQKKVLINLDKMIEEEEEKQKQQGQGQGQGKGKGQQKGQQPNNNTQASRPQDDSYGGTGSGPGNVDPKKFKEMTQVWGTLPEKERAKALQDLTRELPPKHRELIENYFKKLAQTENPSSR
jgi:hypothetical protein